MPVVDDLELPICRLKMSGPAVDAHENRKESGSMVNLEDTIKLPSRAWFRQMVRSLKLLDRRQG